VSTITAGLQFDPEFVFSTVSLRYPVRVNFSILRQDGETNCQNAEEYMTVSNENAGAHTVLGCSAESVAINIFNVLDLESYRYSDKKVERFYVVGIGEVLGYESSSGIQIEWTTNEMIETHSSNLVRKLRSDYREVWVHNLEWF